jgi:hypothetical protein
MTYEQLDAMHDALLKRVAEMEKLSKHCQSIRDTNGMVSANAAYATIVALCDAFKAAKGVTPK